MTLISSLGVDHVIVQPFTKEFSRQSSAEFVRDVLVGALGMKTLAAYVEMTWAAMKNSSPDAEQITRYDLASVLGSAVDFACIQGPGTGGSPTGITATSGINADTFTLATPTWAKLINLQALIAADNVDTSSIVYITTPTIRQWMSSLAY